MNIFASSECTRFVKREREREREERKGKKKERKKKKVRWQWVSEDGVYSLYLYCVWKNLFEKPPNY